MILYIYVLPKGYKDQLKYYHNGRLEFLKKELHEITFHNYSMKQEDNKWKIDGICCSSSNFNHKYCGFYGYNTSLAIMNK
jgi:hypothetical protein